MCQSQTLKQLVILFSDLPNAYKTGKILWLTGVIPTLEDGFGNQSRQAAKHVPSGIDHNRLQKNKMNHVWTQHDTLQPGAALDRIGVHTRKFWRVPSARAGALNLSG